MLMASCSLVEEWFSLSHLPSATDCNMWVFFSLEVFQLSHRTNWSPCHPCKDMAAILKERELRKRFVTRGNFETSYHHHHHHHHCLYFRPVKDGRSSVATRSLATFISAGVAFAVGWFPSSHLCVFLICRISFYQHLSLVSFVDMYEYCYNHDFVWWYVTLEMLFVTLQSNLYGAETEHCFLWFIMTWEED